MPQLRRQPDHALHRACLPRPLRRAAAAAASRPSSSCSPTPFRPRRSGRGLRRQRPDAGAAQPAGRRLGRRRARHRLPSRTASAEFRDGVARAIDYATALGCAAGQLPGRQARRRAPATRAAPRRWSTTCASPRRALKERRHPAADRADQHLRHPRLLPEPHRRRRWRSSTRSARTTSSCSTTSTTRSAWRASSAATLQQAPRRASRHVQLADNPGRNEPGTGEINYPFLFEHIDRIGYARLDRLRIQAARHDRRRASAGCSATRLARATTRTSGVRRTVMHCKIGFIGLGIMGAPMAGHLLKAGHALFVHDAQHAAGRTRRRPAPPPAPSARGVAEQADIIFIMVPDTPDVRGGAVRRGRRRRRASPRARPSST